MPQGLGGLAVRYTRTVNFVTQLGVYGAYRTESIPYKVVHKS